MQLPWKSWEKCFSFGEEPWSLDDVENGNTCYFVLKGFSHDLVLIYLPKSALPAITIAQVHTYIHISVISIVSSFTPPRGRKCVDYIYSPIAFDGRVTSMLQHIQSLPCACVFVALFACSLVQWLYVTLHANKATYAHAQSSGQARWIQSYSLIKGIRL